MPRDGNGVYGLPSGSTAVTGEVAEASTHNTPLNDLATDANTARPVVAGGTGSTTGRDAMAALGGATFDNTRTVSSNATIESTDSQALILADATAGDVTITLPQASTIGDRFRVTIKRTDSSSNTLTIARSGSDTIDGATSDADFDQYEAREYHSNAINWFKRSSFQSTLSFADLSNYATGNFTPSLFGSTVAGTPTFNSRAGNYVRLGNLVQFQLRMMWSSLGGATGDMRIGDLPFTAVGQGSSNTGNSVVHVGNSFGFNVGTGNNLSGLVVANTTFISLAVSSSTSSNAEVTEAELDATGEIYITGSYQIS